MQELIYLRSALARIEVGLTRRSTPTCEWYDGIGADGLAEAQASLERLEKKLPPVPDSLYGNSDTYEVCVTFERSLGEDQKIAEDEFPWLPLAEQLRRQLARELQEACDDGMAVTGVFEVGEATLPA